MKNALLIAAIVVIFVSAGCNGGANSPVNLVSPTGQSTDNPANLEAAYPTPQEPMSMEGYPSPVVNTRIILKSGELPVAPTTVPDPEEGKGSISGVIFSFTTNTLLAETNFYLTSGIGEDKKIFPSVFFGPQPQNGDVTGRTNDKGEFYLNNVPPGNYYFVVEAPYNWAIALVKAEDSDPRLIVVEKSTKQMLGIMFVSWP